MESEADICSFDLSDFDLSNLPRGYDKRIAGDVQRLIQIRDRLIAAGNARTAAQQEYGAAWDELNRFMADNDTLRVFADKQLSIIEKRRRQILSHVKRVGVKIVRAAEKTNRKDFVLGDAMRAAEGLARYYGLDTLPEEIRVHIRSEVRKKFGLSFPNVKR